MVKFAPHRYVVTVLVAVIIATIIYTSWVLLNDTKSIYLQIILVVLVFFVNSFVGIFTGIDEAKGVRGKILAGLIGNIIMNILFLSALFYVVITLNP